jgi:hypothetical protein
MPKEFAFHSAQRVGDNWQINWVYGEKGNLPSSPTGGMFASVDVLKSMLSEAELELHYDENHCALLALYGWLKTDPALASSPVAPNIKGVEVDFSGGAVPQPVRLK